MRSPEVRDGAQADLVVGRGRAPPPARSRTSRACAQRQRAAARADPERAALQAGSSMLRGADINGPASCSSARPVQHPVRSIMATAATARDPSCSASRRAATRPRPPSCAAATTAAARSCPTWCARSSQLHRRFGGVVPEIAARAHVELLDGSSPGDAPRRGSASATSTRSPRRPGPGLIGGLIVGVTTAKAHRAGARPAAGRGQSSGGACADRGPDRGLALSLSAAAGLGRPHPALVVTDVGRYGGSAPPWTMRWARLSTRRPSCSASAYPGGPAVEQAAAAASRSASLCRGRCSGGRSRISRSRA